MKFGRQISFLTYLAPSQKEALDQVAKATGQPRARIIRQAIDAFLRHFEELRGNRP